MISVKVLLVSACSLIILAVNLSANACQGFSLKLKYLNLENVPNEAGKLNWGQGIKLTLEPSGVSDVRWSIPQGTVRDYDERIEDNLIPSSNLPNGFQVHRYEKTSPELNLESIDLYFVRENSLELSATRAATITFRPIGAAFDCVKEASFLMSPSPKPVELYTSDHHDDKQPNQHMGRVIEDHFVWHAFHQLNDQNPHKHPSFLHWHHLFVDRYERWRTTFGYPSIDEISD